MANVVEMTIEKIDEVKSRLGRSLGASMRLRDLIRKVRAARTAAEERAVVERESANIRDSFRDEDNKYRCRDMAKLFYIHMLGYPAHFGQMECMKLVGTKDKRFTDIRIGYLGAMLLLDERSEVHLLVTNCLKSHLNESDQFVTGLALCTLGSICSVEMCRDLSNEVEKLLVKSSNSYIKKKAALCAFRIVRKVPELMSCFMSGARLLLNDKHHGVLLGGLTLVTEMCEKSVDVRNHFRSMVPVLVKRFRELVSPLGSYSSTEHDVNNVIDPFLQVKILRLLRVLGKDDSQSSEAMNDLLTIITTNTDPNKNAGNAVLYEAVLTIMDIKSETSLKILAINLLGRYLVNPDKNIRYVALNTLLKTATADLKTVQKYKGTVLENLKDPDVSIRRRALELCFVLIDKENIAAMTKEILLFLETADPEFKSECASKMYVATETHSPNPVWHLNTMISVLKLAGNYVPEEVVSAMIQLISAHFNLQAYATKKLFRAAVEDGGVAQPLLQIAFWCIGEFGDLLIAPSDDDPEPPTESDVVEMFEQLFPVSIMSIQTREYGIVGLAKLSTRFTSQTERIGGLIRRFVAHMNLELQQRAVEFSSLIPKAELRNGLLERMPVIKHNTLNAAAAPIEDDVIKSNEEDNLLDVGGSSAAPQNTVFNELLDLMGNGDSGSTPVPATSQKAAGGGLEELFGLGINGSSSTSQTSAPVSQASIPGGNDFADLFGGSSTTQPAVEPSKPAEIVVNKSGFEVQMVVENGFASGPAVIRFEIVNNNPVPVENFNLQAAVTRQFQIELLPSSGSRLEADGMSTTTQLAKITKLAENRVPKLRLKLNYSLNGSARTFQEDITVQNLY
ncbi:unnamed protein product [Bursaphelenchus xylophilus]|uniref:AP-1 complex subunit gamma n=2 Tax=Bursaphelenchus xylophilus TaxID=6326 RepID=A0A7I8XAV3_BURXY|nr:unnamed protein product [Bursaphelenchus xylophilus]CAG9083315.1 unnamed protein product [Bursaphelenchus xylophilus]